MLNYILGDHPELQFEAGNQIGGSYPCMCGVKVDRFNNTANCYESGNTFSLEQRRQKV